MYNSQKLKLNLKLLQQRIKAMSAKKQSLSTHVRKEIANLVADGKHESARIKVESVIREDYLIEAFEVLSLLCEILIARFGLIDNPTNNNNKLGRSKSSMVVVDEGIQESVQSLIYAAPRCSADLKELVTIAQYLKSKFGREYYEAAGQNRLGQVNPRVVSRLSVQRPSEELVTAYVREICKTFHVDFDEERHLKLTSSYGAIGAGSKNNIPLFLGGNGQQQQDLMRPAQPPDYSSPTHDQQQSGYTQDSQQQQTGQQQQYQLQQQGAQRPSTVISPQNQPSAPVMPNQQQQQSQGPTIPQLPDSDNEQQSQFPQDQFGFNDKKDGLMNGQQQQQQQFQQNQQQQQQRDNNNNSDVDNLPSVPLPPPPTEKEKSPKESEDPDFDELARRFEELKKRK
ncbi:hypothetical protein MP228_008881 [Amoeboaphelidium protococcarum]|nr:hypothetical protein MP228_008881 [Amoeboaphelidium protococcarum]